jgi:hypothetical protein
LLQTAPLLSTRLASTNIHQASSFMIHRGSIQITHHHATLSFWFFLSRPGPIPQVVSLQNAPVVFQCQGSDHMFCYKTPIWFWLALMKLIMSWYKKPLRFSITSSHVFFRWNSQI